MSDFGDALMQISAATNGAQGLADYNKTVANNALTQQQTALTGAQAQAGNLTNQQTLSALQALTAAKNSGVTNPLQLYGAVATSNPSALADYASSFAKNPLAMANVGWQGGQGAQTPAGTTAAGGPAQPAQDPSALQPETPDDKRNYQFLNTQVPPQYRALIRQISNGDESVGNADSIRSNGLLALATQFDPSLSKTNFTDRVQTAKDFASGGKSGQALTSINTATKHLAQVALAGLDLHNGSVPALNWTKNEFNKALGADPLTNLNSTVQTVAPELAKAASGGGDTTEADRQAQADSFGGSLSPKQLLGTAAGKVDLMQSKAQELGNTYQKNMGRAPKQTINPANQQTLDDIKALHGFAQQNKLDSPEAQTVVQRLRGAVGQTPQGSVPAAVGGIITATNPKTGQKVQLVNGKWVPQ